MQTDFENDGRAVCLPFRSAHDFRLSVNRKDTKKPPSLFSDGRFFMKF
jgi:hypothetical protein